MCGRKWKTCRCPYTGVAIRRIDRRHIDIEWDELANHQALPEARHEIRERLEHVRRMRYEYDPEFSLGDANGRLGAGDDVAAGLVPEESQGMPSPNREMACRHDRAILREGGDQCSLCAHQSSHYIYFCIDCGTQLCASCRRGQTLATVNQDIADARAGAWKR